MNGSGDHLDIRKLSAAGVIITLGIVFGDLGTSPLYVMQAIISGGTAMNELLILGSMSCIFWTITIQTTLKYVIITLRANNNGEGGIYALFALLRKKTAGAAILTMIGSSALLADGVITPAITVTSSIEGLKLFNPEMPVIPIVLAIFAVLFFMQQYGTNIIGGSFGPLMLVWFTMLAVLGLNQVFQYPEVLEALSPFYAIRFLAAYPGGFILLGAVFLATTGAEALYSDLGHCGAKNIRAAWILVKISLILNYLGQCAWILQNNGNTGDVNPFYGIMPEWFLFPGIFIATVAAIIASQALITGSFTLISEAVSLNFWPRTKVENPTLLKGQVYVPAVNWFLWVACSSVVLFFRRSSNMEAAYGLSITITMIMTTLLLSYYFFQRRVSVRLIIFMVFSFLVIEGSFLVANLHKFKYGGWFTLMLASVFFLIMYGWYFGRKMKNRYVSFANLNDYIEHFRELSDDDSVPLTASNLVFIIKANNPVQVESKVIYSIFRKQPKRAKTYWLLHVDIKDEPYTFEYKVNQIIPGILIRVDFSLGFKIDTTIYLYFRQVIEDLKRTGEISLESGYSSIRKHSPGADFLFVMIDRILSRDSRLTINEKLVFGLHRLSGLLSISAIKALKLDSSITVDEKVPILKPETVTERIKRTGIN